MAKRTIPLIINQIEEVRESELNKGLYPWRILTTLYNMREKEDNETLHDIRQQYSNLVYPVPVPRRTNYKKAVRQRVDVSDLDSDLGDLWDQLAALLIEESHSIARKRGTHD